MNWSIKQYHNLKICVWVNMSSNHEFSSEFLKAVYATVHFDTYFCFTPNWNKISLIFSLGNLKDV